MKVDAAESISCAAIFVWLGMVLAISFLEAPLKFRAPGVTLQVGLGIGRLVFKALNAAEAVLAGAVISTTIVGQPPTSVLAPVVMAIVALVMQLAWVRPRLARRSDVVLAGTDASRSRSHHVYVALEGLKVLALAIAGVAILAIGH